MAFESPPAGSGQANELRATTLRSYRIAGISQPKGGEPSTYKITIPAYIGRLIPPETEFVPEFHEDGILLRRADRVELPPLPEWVNGG